MSYQVEPPLNTQLFDGTKTVAATGTPEALVASTKNVREVAIVPLRTNTAPVYIGVSAANDGQHITLPYIFTAPQDKFIDLSQIYVDVTVNGEGVYFVYTI